MLFIIWSVTNKFGEGKREMKKKVTKSVTTLAVSMGLVCSAFAPMSLEHPVNARTNTSIEQMLAALTPAQRLALNQLQLNDQTGLQLSPDVNLESDELISVIVEFKTKPAKVAMMEAQAQGKTLSTSHADLLVEEAHDSFQKDADKILKQKNYHIKRTFKTAFNGVAMTLPANEVQSLLSSSSVKAVWSDEEVKLDQPVEMSESASSAMPSSLSFIGIDKLHQEGFTGKGIKIGVLDTGIDYQHPDLKDAFKGGYDFIDNDSDPMETTYDEWIKAGKPSGGGSTFYTQHGTHVAGTIAARAKNDSPNALKGVAPDADLYAYRVLGPFGSGSTQSIIAGIDKAVSDGMDVINLSLGANYNDPLFATSIAINNAVLQGVTAVVAAGNTGNKLYSLGSPGAASLALTVGASDVSKTSFAPKGTLHTNEEKNSANLQIVAENFDFPMTDLKGQEFAIVDVGSGLDADYVGKDVTGKIVIMNLFRANVGTKITNAKKYKAKAVIFYDADYTTMGYLGQKPNYIPAFFIPKQEGVAFDEKVKQSQTATFTFDEFKEQVSSDGDHLADFSSRGPARMTYDIKPEITAPGVEVLSTVPSYVYGPEYFGNYDVSYQKLSGTSMATPHVSGIAALLKQKNPKLTPFDIKTTLMNTADPLRDAYSVFEVGAGRVDPYEAIHSDVNILVSDETQTVRNEKEKTIKEKTGAISFGTFAPGGQEVIDSRSLFVNNNSNLAKTFDVKVQFHTDRAGSKDAAANGVMIQADETIKVNAGSNKQSQVKLVVPANAALGTYEGYITYTNQANPEEMYQVPFAVRLVEKGIAPITLSPNTFTTESDSFHLGLVNNASLIFGFKSHMRNVDLILVDGKTNEEIGFIGYVDGIPLMEDTYYIMSKAFDGTYYPFTGDKKNPIAEEAVLAKPGSYKIKFIATDDQEETFVSEGPIYIDNNKPTLKLDMADGIYEYEPGQQTVRLQGSIFDKEIEAMKENGFNRSQASNKIMYSYNEGTNKALTVDESGAFSVDVPMIPTKPIVPVALHGIDAASNKDFRSNKQLFFVKKGTTYAKAQPDKQEVKMGETFKYTLSLNNVNHLKEAVFSFKYLKTYFDLVEIKPNPEGSKYGEVSIKPEVTDSGNLRTMKITATLPNQAEVSGNVQLVDVTLKVRDDKFIKEPTALGSLTTSYKDANGSIVQVSSASFYVSMIPTFSESFGDVKAEGLLRNGALYFGYDYSKIGGAVKATDENGAVYNGVFSNLPTFTLSKLPITDKPLTFSLDIPGHFTITKDFMIGDQDGESLIGQRMRVNYNTAVAGDVNKDDVIDVLDAISIQKYWETNQRESDINFDGIVDAKDMMFVQKNYLMQNPTVDNAPLPTKSFKGQTLENVLKTLGM